MPAAIAWTTIRPCKPAASPLNCFRRSTWQGSDICVPAQPAKEVLAGCAAEPAAVLAEISGQPDLVVRRPCRQEFSEAAVLRGDALDEGGVLAHRHDLLAVAHDTLVGGEIVPEILRLEEQRLRFEAKECFLETWPFDFDDPPDEPRREYALGHGRQDAVVRHIRQRGVVGLRTEQLVQRRLAPFAPGGAFADFLEAWHGADPILRVRAALRKWSRQPPGPRRSVR